MNFFCKYFKENCFVFMTSLDKKEQMMQLVKTTKGTSE